MTGTMVCESAGVVDGVGGALRLRAGGGWHLGHFPRVRAGFVSNTALAQLVAAHVGERGATQSAVEVESTTLAARIELAANTIADLDRRLRQIDSAVEETAKRQDQDRPIDDRRPTESRHWPRG
jgi:hypothetical protein